VLAALGLALNLLVGELVEKAAPPAEEQLVDAAQENLRNF
jgi:hypothetical protein